MLVSGSGDHLDRGDLQARRLVIDFRFTTGRGPIHIATCGEVQRIMNVETRRRADVAVVAASRDRCVDAEKLAIEIGCTVESASCMRSKAGYWLVVDRDGLALQETGSGAAGPIRVDFLRGPTAHRARSGGSRKQPIATAIGLRRGCRAVIDATAGLGQDAFLLAHLGCRVLAIERSPVLFALLRDGLSRAITHGEARVREIAERITLVKGDSRELLTNVPSESQPDTVYLDPMYTPQRGRGQVNKAMRVCRALVGDDDDATELFDAARRVARRRIVVKRHRHAPVLSPDPAHRHYGSTVRYDVYPVSS